jgi:nucleoside-diphosphate kinase
LESQKQSCVAVVKSSEWGKLGEGLVALAAAKGHTVGRMKSVQLTVEQADSRGDSELAKLPCVAVEVIGTDCEAVAAEVLGQVQSSDAAEFFFNTPLATSATFVDCSILIIRPHILLEGVEGELIVILQRYFQISALKKYHFDRKTAKEFLDIYFDVIAHANLVVEELSSGPCIVVEVKGENVHSQLRKLCGPHDPEIARHLQPNTIRAQYGKDLVKNAVHCTDLEGDGPLESHFLFEKPRR